MDLVIAAIVGVVCGAAVVLLVLWLRRPQQADLARELVEQAQSQHLQDLEALLERLRGVFGDLAQQALTRSNEQFLQLAETRLSAQTKQGESALEARKRLIDETVKQITARLNEVAGALQTLDKDRRQSHGELAQRLEHATKATADLHATTEQLRAALAHPQRRGQWGERMAADVLRLAGFVEGVNYHKQTTTEAGRRPDFTFPLPHDRHVNMDVKFPLPNYLNYVDATDDAARERYRTQFLRDVRTRLREVTTREYIDPHAGTVDYVLVFIPNEQVYSFIHEQDPALLDEALQNRVVLCSPLTLYAMLAVIRQATESLRVEQASREILALLGKFNKEWGKYTDVMDRMGRSLAQAMDRYEELTTTRTRQLDRQLDRIEDLRTARQIPLPADADSSADNG